MNWLPTDYFLSDFFSVSVLSVPFLPFLPFFSFSVSVWLNATVAAPVSKATPSIRLMIVFIFSGFSLLELRPLEPSPRAQLMYENSGDGTRNPGSTAKVFWFEALVNFIQRVDF